MARQDRHGDLVAEALVEAVGGGDPREFDAAGMPHMLVTGGNPLGGLDDVATRIARGWGWTIVDYGDERAEVAGGTGTGNYRAITKAGADLILLFPGLNDTDAREAELWAIREGIRYRGYPLTARASKAAAR